MLNLPLSLFMYLDSSEENLNIVSEKHLSFRDSFKITCPGPTQDLVSEISKSQALGVYILRKLPR